MSNNKTHNLSIPGIDKHLFDNPFYQGKCEKIDFSGVIEEYKIETDKGTDYISLVPKFIPHSDYELMLQSTDSILKSPITSLTDEALYEIFGIGYEYIKFFGDPSVIERYNMLGGYPYLVYNYDEFTTDRHSGMSKKAWHLHMNSWSGATIQTIAPIDKEKVSHYYYRSVVDPIFDVTRGLTLDALDTDELKGYIKRANPICDNQIIYYSSIYEVTNGWKSLLDKDFIQALKVIHEKLEERYIEILQCFCGVSEVPEL